MIDNHGWVTWPAPAKLNLFLHITGQRADGYHELQTVFDLIDWCDWVCLKPRADGRIRHTNPLDGVPEASDLTVRAAKILQQVTGGTWGVDIRIDKHLPMGGGLGGGSSNAASVLHGLNAMFALGLNQTDLAKLGAQLGADVPIFVHGTPAFAEGVGEQITPIQLPFQHYVVVVPDVQVPTSWAFSHSALTRDCARATIRDFAEGRLVDNVFESLVVQHHAPVRAALEQMADFGRAQLSGTGACCFLQMDDKTSADQAANALTRQGLNARTVVNVPQSPLLHSVHSYLECSSRDPQAIE